jgi:hypothetical protein
MVLQLPYKYIINHILLDIHIKLQFTACFCRYALEWKHLLQGLKHKKLKITELKMAPAVLFVYK